MSANAPPVRFLLLLVGGWICVRSAVLMPGWWAAPGPAAAVPQPPPRGTAILLAAKSAPVPLRESTPREALFRRSGAAQAAAPPQPAFAPLPPAAASPVPRGPPDQPLRPLPACPGVLPPHRRDGRRWSVAAWLLLRGKTAPGALAPGTALGGSQAGMRLTWRLAGERRPLALSGRLYAPLDSPAGAEAAVGVDWRPLAAVPLHLLAERREALGSNGRSDFALTVFGGVAGRPLPAGLRLDAYGQAGLIGLSSPDAFADGSVAVRVPAGPVEIGAAAWAAAQPGASRLDAGPQLRWRLPVEGADLSLSAEYRFRLAGDAEPGSGPALTVGADF